MWWIFLTQFYGNVFDFSLFDGKLHFIFIIVITHQALGSIREYRNVFLIFIKTSSKQIWMCLHTSSRCFGEFCFVIYGTKVRFDLANFYTSDKKLFLAIVPTFAQTILHFSDIPSWTKNACNRQYYMKHHVKRDSAICVL